MISKLRTVFFSIIFIFFYYLIFNTGAIVSDKQNADFAVGDWESLLPLDEFKTGVP